MVNLHSLGPLTKHFAYFNFKLIGYLTTKQFSIIDGALNSCFDKLVDVADIVIRL
jgi:hypothetical protein